MSYIGQIQAVSESTPIDTSKWMVLIESHPSLRNVPPHKGINPFTRQPCEFYAPKSTAQVAVAGARVGAIEWAMDGLPFLLVDADDEWIDFVVSVAEDVATKLGARFVRMSDED